MTVDALLKAISDLGAIAAFVWFVVMFQRGEIVSRVTVERIITEVTTRTITEISARIITAVELQLKDHNNATDTAHAKILGELSEADKIMTEVEKTMNVVEQTVRELGQKRQW